MAGSNDRPRQTTPEFLGQGSLLKCLHSGDVFTAIWGRFFSRYTQPSPGLPAPLGANMADKGRRTRKFREHLPSPADAPIHEHMEGKLVQSRMGRPKYGRIEVGTS